MQTPPNNKDTELVGIFFTDSDVASIFTELLQSQGAPACMLSDPTELRNHTRIITEPRYFPEIRPEHYQKCLIVGNKDCLLSLPLPTLSRPLTEEKVLDALAAFLNP